jgi:hypothetical protein
MVIRRCWLLRYVKSFVGTLVDLYDAVVAVMSAL